MENTQNGKALKTLKIVLVFVTLFGFISCILLNFTHCYPMQVPFNNVLTPTPVFDYQVKLAKAQYLVSFIDSLGVILLLIGASFVFGSILGFLFGIPHNSSNTAQSQTNNPDNTQFKNDNLTQISDWLTKIIVGASLVSLNKVPTILKKLDGFLISHIGWVSFLATGVEAAIFLYLGLGFATGYLWARIKFLQTLQ